VQHHVFRLDEALDLAGIVEREDVGMAQPGGDLDLALESLGTDGGGKVRMQDLDCDGPSVLEILGEVDLAMPPLPTSRSMRYRSASASVK
jgi:hypothetical protein